KKAGNKKSGERKKDRKKAKSARKSAKKRTPTDPKTAAREKKRKRRGIIAGTLVTVTAVALALVLALDMTGRSGLLTGPLGAILAPVQSAVSSVTSSLQEKINAFNYNLELERDLTAAEQELATINTKIARYDEVVAENERLRALMNNYEKYQQYEPMFARVIGKDMGNWFSNFTVDKGTSSGVTKGMTVMSADGVVGRVVEVGLNYAKVLTIIDGTSGVAVLIERNRDNGVVRGMVDDTTGENLLQMNYL
ncbi:MAG: rod shape-determining protein MreC, partial [Christensenellales bacterium]